MAGGAGLSGESPARTADREASVRTRERVSSLMGMLVRVGLKSLLVALQRHYRPPLGITGKMIRDGYFARWWTVFTAVCIRRWRLRGSPVFGFTSNRGKLLLETST